MIVDALMDKLLFHYHQTKLFKRLNPKFWNPEISWKNKWKNGNKEEGEKFPFSSTFLVSFTDGWHLLKTIKFWLTALYMLVIMFFPYWWVVLIILAWWKIGFTTTFWLLERGS